MSAPCACPGGYGSTAKDGSLHILDLPLDMLKAILREIYLASLNDATQMRDTDLTSLALVNSTMHSLVTPVLYRRFDIIWPDDDAPSDPKLGVDALTFGLSTLAMRDDLYHKAKSDTPPESVRCGACGHVNHASAEILTPFVKSRRGNSYSHFVKTFSLSNGPEEMIRDYVITNERGKLLGTLVAICIARMPNLEEFIWDLPSGIVRDIWISLSSLGDEQPSMLGKIHVRFHNNSKAYKEAGLVRSSSSTAAPPATSGPHPSSGSASQTSAKDKYLVYSNNYVESPNFSILPPLRSISAIAIDELTNLHELGVLIAKSVDKLRELAVGMALSLCTSGMPDAQINDLLANKGEVGTLDVLFRALLRIGLDDGVARISGENQRDTETAELMQEPTSFEDVVGIEAPMNSPIQQAQTTENALSDTIDMESIDPVLAPSKPPIPEEEKTSLHSGKELYAQEKDSDITTALPKTTEDLQKQGLRIPTRLIQKLKLEVLALEWHCIQPRILTDAIDWTMLTSLTLLKCIDTPSLWRHLASEYAPLQSPKSFIDSLPANSFDKKSRDFPRLRRMPSSPRVVEQSKPTYRLRLKRIHTDSVSTELIIFLQKTLVPHSLEWLLLRNDSAVVSTVTMNQIYNGVLKRHRRSLTKVLLNSYDGLTRSSHKKWMLQRDHLAHMFAVPPTNNNNKSKFPRIRELSFSLDYKDWHFFLQQLLNIPTLRSLHLPHIISHVWGAAFSAREVAKCVVDIVNLRKECELAYLAIYDKCFEVVEAPVKARSWRKKGQGGGDVNGGGAQESSSEDYTPGPSDEDNDEADDDDDDGSEDGGIDPEEEALDRAVGVYDKDSSDEEEEALMASGNRPPQVKLRLREILFFDKIEIFNARKGGL
ncbi:uncharacterized protein KY384_002681 [Bacidia gigantensis]|uniref:uncharacterized protein n=1 Tax=Bacidia gigantensis TaxID=2732470 RepID=UPI001D038C65|nr:uncharacterized protein KY384_002681 [Bacidia gigantensis]KAG8532803.1 hypothetical protein KY384_002681 [Bacidia gigantensis]